MPAHRDSFCLLWNVLHQDKTEKRLLDLGVCRIPELIQIQPLFFSGAVAEPIFRGIFYSCVLVLLTGCSSGMGHPATRRRAFRFVSFSARRVEGTHEDNQRYYIEQRV